MDLVKRLQASSRRWLQEARNHGYSDDYIRGYNEGAAKASGLITGNPGMAETMRLASADAREIVLAEEGTSRPSSN